MQRINDVGVAGLHRLLAQLESLRAGKIIVVVAGMEAALASVVAGLVSAPVIAVPTSVGYGASFQGLAALLGMLNACAPGVSVVNIDNGFGAGYLAAQINLMLTAQPATTDSQPVSRNRWLLLGLLAVVVFAALLAYGDVRQIGALLARFPPGWFAAAAGLAVLNYALRYIRWAMYLRALNIRVPHSVCLLVFLAGLALSITPGKVGELLKSVWLSQRAGVPVAQSAPAVVMERLTDVVAVGLLALVGLALLPPAVGIAIGAVLAVFW